nr:transposase [Clostridium homopropionicum]
MKEIRSSIDGIEKDYASVENSVMFKESNGVLEGNVNRLKMIKRSMFGKASFELLRRKVPYNI